MKNSITGIIVKGRTSKLFPNLNYEFSLRTGIRFYCDRPVCTESWSSGGLNDTQVDSIISQCIDNERFIENGAWSIVSFSSKRNSLLFVRDVVGIQPLYYSICEDFLAFSSSLQYLLALIDSTVDLDVKSLADMLILNKMEYSEDTLIEQVKEIQQGESVFFDFENWQLKKKNYVKKTNKFEISDYGQILRENRNQLEYFVNDSNKLYSSQSNALLLSGGIDSSCLAHLLYPRVDKGKLSLYTMSYRSKKIDETRYAEAISNQFPHSPWHSITTNSNELVEDVEDMHSIIEWPTLSAGTYNQFKLIKKSKEDKNQIIWDGLGADAIYGGHDYYRHHLLFTYLRAFKISAAKELLGWKGNVMNQMLNSFKTLLKGHLISTKWIMKWMLSYKKEMEIYNPEFLNMALDKIDKYQPPFRKSSRDMMYDDYFNGGVRHLSRFTNRLSNHFDIEMKYPFAENVKWANNVLSLPYEQLFNHGASKSLLRDSFKKDLPSEVLDRRDKKGLLSPNNLWIEEQKEFWIQYFDYQMSEIYDVEHIRKNYKSMWNISGQPENYRHFKHISFAIWRKVMNI